MDDPADIDRRHVGPGSKRRKLRDDDVVDENAPQREGHVQKATVGPGRRRRTGRGRGRGKQRPKTDEDDFEPETTVGKARIGPGRRKRGRGRGRRPPAEEGDGDVSVSKARIGPQRRRRNARDREKPSSTRGRIGPTNRRRGPMREGGRAGRRVRKTGSLPTDVPIVSGVMSISGLSIAEVKQADLEYAIKYALADAPQKHNVKVTEDEDIIFVDPKPGKNDSLQLGFKMALREVSQQDKAATIANQIKLLISRANGRSFVNSVKRASDDVAISSKAISVSCVGEVEVLMPNAPLVNIASADVGRVSVLAGKSVRDDVVARVSGGVILSGVNEDVSKKTLINAFKGTMADIPYELGFHTSPNDVLITKEDLKGDQMHLDFEIVLGKDDVAGQENLEELVSELNGAMGKHGGREMLSALKRKNQELGDGSLDNAKMKLTVVKELQASMVGDGAIAQADEVAAESDSNKGVSSIGLLNTLTALVKARTKFSSLFKTMKGSVNLKGVKAEEFDASASMHKALKDALMTILMNLGLSRQNARIKLMNAKNVTADKVTVSYRIRLRSDAKDLAEAVLQALKKTFSEKSSRTEFLEGFWKTHRTMDSRLKRRMQRQERRRLGNKNEQKTSSGARGMRGEATEQVASVEKTRQVGPTAGGRRRRNKGGRGRGAGAGADDSTRRVENRRARRRGASEVASTEEERAVPVEKARVGPARRRRGRGRGRRMVRDENSPG